MKYAVAAAAMALLLGPAYAYETPTKEQAAKVESTLKAAGFTKWERIERDGDHFEVDDAIDASGKKFDLRLDGKTYKVTSKVQD